MIRYIPIEVGLRAGNHVHALGPEFSGEFVLYVMLQQEEYLRHIQEESNYASKEETKISYVLKK
jgi:hypothetical protein